jgi:hypothetical protein
LCSKIFLLFYDANRASLGSTEKVGKAEHLSQESRLALAQYVKFWLSKLKEKMKLNFGGHRFKNCFG